MINTERSLSQQRHIPVSSPDFSGNERKYILDCLDRGWITQGPFVREFEEEFARVCGVNHVIACSSGTAALHLALLALGIGPTDAVIVPTLTYVATANCARYCDADVHFCDIDRDSWCLDPDLCYDLEQELLLAYRSVITIPVNLYDSLCITKSDPDTTVVDSSHAPGRDYQPRGQACRVSTHSFFASKIIACGEGGAVATNDSDLADLLRLYRGQGATGPGCYHHSVIGYNYRMTDLQAAIGLAQLERMDQILAYRRDIINHYRFRLSGSSITLQGGQRASGWMCAVLVPETSDRDRIADLLFSHGIETRPFFKPLPSLPPYSRYPTPPVSDEIARRGLCLPTHTRMTLADVDYVCDCLLGAVNS